MCSRLKSVGTLLKALFSLSFGCCFPMVHRNKAVVKVIMKARVVFPKEWRWFAKKRKRWTSLFICGVSHTYRGWGKGHVWRVLLGQDECALEWQAWNIQECHQDRQQQRSECTHGRYCSLHVGIVLLHLWAQRTKLYIQSRHMMLKMLSSIHLLLS